MPNSIDFPRCCVLLCGHPCCLKSSLALRVAIPNQILTLNSFAFGRISARWGVDFRKQRDSRYRNLFSVTTAALQTGLPILIEGTFENRRERTFIKNACRRFNIPLVVVYCHSTSIRPIVARMRYRKKSACGPDFQANSIAIYRDSIKRFTPISVAEFHSYDAYVKFDSAHKVLEKIFIKENDLISAIDRIQDAAQTIGW